MTTVEIYSPALGPRLRYIGDFIFKTVLNADAVSYIDQPEFKAPIRIAYTTASIPNAFHIVPCGLLEEQGLRHQPIQVIQYENLPAFFASDGRDLPFDILSVAFFLLTRYEEYLPGLRDEHNRFAASYSTASHLGILQLPYIDMWAGRWADLLRSHFNTRLRYRSEYSASISVDVDFPFAFKGRTFSAHTLLLAKDLSRLEKERFFARLQYMGTGKDPYDTFDEIITAAANSNLPLMFFCQTGDRGKYDKNILPDHAVYKELLQKLTARCRIGMHPSYQSADQPRRLLEERERLEQVLDHKIFDSRQHYIRTKTPDSYRKLNETGIIHDYSMGYVDQPGFRASTSRSFRFYDVEKDQITPLMLHPFAVMDSVFVNHLLVGKQKAVQMTQEIIERIRETRGHAHAVFHNPILSRRFEWKDWPDFFYKILEIL